MVPTIRTTLGFIATAALALSALSAPRARAWDSQTWNPTHATHSRLTEWAIDQLKGTYPELETYRKQLVEGANEELHERKVSGTKYGVNLEAKRVEHKGTNEGCDDVEGWWKDARAAYKAGDKKKAYVLLGVLLHMVEDMGVPAHANKVVHQGNPVEFDNFEFMALTNWRPSFDDIDRKDPGYPEPWKYYAFSQEWTHADAPNYKDRNAFSKTWTLAKPEEKALLRNRQGRTCHVVKWTLESAAKAFGKP
jgi:hypothetical protein